MLCSICKSREANIFYTEIVGGVKKEQYLCEECAAENTSLRLKLPFGGQEISLGGLLSGMLEGAMEREEQQEENEAPKSHVSCSGCGLTFDEFKQSGQFGCAKCYQSFGKLLNRNLRNIQGADTHSGKQPKNKVAAAEFDSDTEKLPELDESEKLSMQLEQAIEREDYEMAAVLRDRLRALKAVK